MFTAIRTIAAEQGQVVSAKQLIGAGLSARRILRWSDEGVLVEQARRVYSLDSTVSKTGRLWAAWLSTGSRGVISHQSAVMLLDLMTEPGKAVHLTFTKRPPRPQPGIVVLHQRALTDREVVEVDGLPCTGAARTIADRAPDVDSDKLANLLDRAVHLRLFDRTAFDWQTTVRKPKGTAALVKAIDWLDHTAGNNRVESERRLIALIRNSGLPPAANNVRLGMWEVDVHWIGTRAIIEADSDAHHSTPKQIADDIARQQALEAFGFKFLRLSWKEINYDTDRTIDRIDRFRLANLDPPQPGLPPEMVA